jgi:succinate dehydrogenase/fumarate reductase flavoprotein subunit
VRYARGDLMGLVREDLVYGIARHVDATVHKFEEWGLPILKNPQTGEAARKSASEVYNRIMVTHLLMASCPPHRLRHTLLRNCLVVQVLRVIRLGKEIPALANQADELDRERAR